MRSLGVIGALAALCLTAGGSWAQSEPEQPVQTDLRDLRVGMSISDLPRAGYADFSCVGPDRRPIAGWAGFEACAPDEHGGREVEFRYDDTPDHETKVAGQPVLLSVVLDGRGVVEAIKMRTDPAGRVFVRKRGVHFGERVMAHYGEKGWSCSEAEPTAQERPVGAIFIREHCVKTLGVRYLVVDRALFRDASQPLDTFTSTSSFTVSLVDRNGH